MIIMMHVVNHERIEKCGAEKRIDFPSRLEIIRKNYAVEGSRECSKDFFLLAVTNGTGKRKL
jgi:hypothetical protein